MNIINLVDVSEETRSFLATHNRNRTNNFKHFSTNFIRLYSLLFTNKNKQKLIKL